MVLIMAGFVGVGFEKAVNAVSHWRLGVPACIETDWILLFPLAFILSALLAVVG